MSDLTEGPISRTLLVFSLPVLGANVLQSLNGSVNQFWVSHTLGVDAVTAIGNSNIVMMLMVGAMFGVSMAANILIGQAMGARDLALVKKVMGTSITFFTVLSIVIALVGYPASRHILAAMGTPADALPQAETYLRIVFLSTPFLFAFAFLQMAQRGIGDSRTPFYFMLLAVVLDSSLNPLLIRGIGPFPRMAIAGSGMSTFIGQGVSLACLVVALYLRRSPLMPRPGEFHLLKPDLGIVKTLLTRGLPMGMQLLAMSGSALVMISFVNAYGSTVAAAFTAATQVWTYLQMPAMALGAAVSSMAAQSIGAGKWERVDRIAWASVANGLAITGAIALVIYLSGDATLHLFLPPDSPALPIARHINEMVLWSFVFFSITFALSGVVRATGAVWPPLAILVLSMFVIRVPFAQWLTPWLGADAVWWSFPLGTLSSAALTMAYYTWGHWRGTTLLPVHAPTGQVADCGMATPAMTEPRHVPGHPAAAATVTAAARPA
jgi:putative MATE family efflux protein